MNYVNEANEMKEANVVDDVYETDDTSYETDETSNRQIGHIIQCNAHYSLTCVSGRM